MMSDQTPPEPDLAGVLQPHTLDRRVYGLAGAEVAGMEIRGVLPSWL